MTEIGCQGDEIGELKMSTATPPQAPSESAPQLRSVDYSLLPGGGEDIIVAAGVVHGVLPGDVQRFRWAAADRIGGGSAGGDIGQLVEQKTADDDR